MVTGEPCTTGSPRVRTDATGQCPASMVAAEDAVMRSAATPVWCCSVVLATVALVIPAHVPAVASNPALSPVRKFGTLTTQLAKVPPSPSVAVFDGTDLPPAPVSLAASNVDASPSVVVPPPVAGCISTPAIAHTWDAGAVSPQV